MTNFLASSATPACGRNYRAMSQRTRIARRASCAERKRAATVSAPARVRTRCGGAWQPLRGGDARGQPASRGSDDGEDGRGG